MTDKEVSHHLAEMDRLEEADQWGTKEFYASAVAAFKAMSGAQREVLKQLLFKGPVWDGNIASKAARGDLFQWGLAVRCCFKGEQGHTAATYRVYTIWKAVEEAQLGALGLEGTN